MKKSYILALDQGTTSSRAILYNKQMQIVGIENEELTLYYPQPGYVEQKPDDLFVSQVNCAKKLLEKLNISSEEIDSIGITNQRETTVVWDKQTGKPIYNALVWQDSRTSDYCSKLKEAGHEKLVRSKTGLVIDSYFSASKINWIINNVSGAKEKAKQGDLLFGTVDTWLLWNLSGGKKYATDYSNASRTLFFNIENHCWDDELLNLFEIKGIKLPEVFDSSYDFGKTNKEIFGVEIPINSLIGDQQSALFGQRCFNAGDTKNTYGTGCFMLMNTGEKIIRSQHGLLSTIAWGINGKIEYALEGSVFIAGAVIQWLRDSLGIINSAAETENMAKAVENTQGVYFVPAFTGLGTPYWDMYVRGTIVGLTRGVNKNHIVRAALESLAYRTKEVLYAMMDDSGLEMNSLKVDGGASANGFLMQFQADILDKVVLRPGSIETTAFGAALLAGLKSGFWNNHDIDEFGNTDTEFVSKMNNDVRQQLFNGWQKAISNLINSYK
jgi:glycerol kinase